MGRQLAIQNISAGGNTLRVPEGRYKFLNIVFEGTNTAAQDIALSDLGTVTIVKNGRPLVAAVDMVNMMHYANLMGGLLVFSSTTGAAAFGGIPYFCFDPGAPENILVVGDQDYMTITLTWGAGFFAATGLQSGTVKIVGEQGEGVQHYEHHYNQYNFSLSAAGTIKERIPGENFARLILTDMDDTDITRIMIYVDGAVVHDCTRVEALSMSNLISRLEEAASVGTGELTSTQTAQFAIVSSGKFSEALSDDLQLTIIGAGAIEPEVLVTSLDFTPDDAVASAATSRSRLDAKLRNKRQHGKKRPVQLFEQQPGLQITPAAGAAS